MYQSDLVSVVIATRNYGQYISHAITSVIQQTYPYWELIIVDDGSTDATPAVVAKWRGHPRIRYYRLEGTGQAPAKNLGIRLSRGEFIAFLDADDLWLPDKLTKQVTHLRQHPAAGVAYTRRILIGPDGTAIAEPQASSGTDYPSGWILDKLLIRNFVCFSSSIVRKTVFDHIGLFDESRTMAIDYDLWLRIARYYPFVCVNEPLVKYRTGHNNLSRRVDERGQIALSIIQKFMTNSDIKEYIPSSIIKTATFSIYCTLGYVNRPKSLVRSLEWYIRAWSLKPYNFAVLRSSLITMVYYIFRWFMINRLGRNNTCSRTVPE